MQQSDSHPQRLTGNRTSEVWTTSNPPNGQLSAPRQSSERFARLFQWLHLPICGASLLLAARAPTLVVVGTYYTILSVIVILLILALALVSRLRVFSSAQLQAMLVTICVTVLAFAISELEGVESLPSLDRGMRSNSRRSNVL